MQLSARPADIGGYLGPPADAQSSSSVSAGQPVALSVFQPTLETAPEPEQQVKLSASLPSSPSGEKADSEQETDQTTVRLEVPLGDPVWIDVESVCMEKKKRNKYLCYAEILREITRLNHHVQERFYCYYYYIIHLNFTARASVYVYNRPCVNSMLILR